MRPAAPGLARPSLRGAALGVPWVLGAGVVIVQIAFPLTGGGTPALTVLSVVLFALASVGHALLSRGPATAAGLVVVAGGIGLGAEAIGLATGLPFGEYTYTDALGATLLGVPLLVPTAWIMMSYPALLAARRLVAGFGLPRAATVPVAAWALATWDVFLDPQMVEAGNWYWHHPTPTLPGVDGIPLSNYAGWLVVALLLAAALDRVVVRTPEADDRLPHALYLWTYGSSVLAAAAFFGRPGAALVGGLLMGVVAVPLALVLRRDGARS